ncbi:hypothetical protein DPMN_186404 [Dreissena polymorpha]|uniref:Uncharacterized protein n=1 Tax=Dreissena polymorpha TaxID=45954 RepID=A0A9D4DMK2_DREPO|nr:hypothetical protein DPMN_186404 [Dreissena polymorpha]
MHRWRFDIETSPNFFLSPLYNHEDSICVQIQPYLYYLQYLTYRELNQEHKQSEALTKLSIFTEINKFTGFVSHFDTSLNMLGHCFELEKKFESAWMTYKTSLHMLPEKNAAVLHIIRLLWHRVRDIFTIILK